MFSCGQWKRIKERLNYSASNCGHSIRLKCLTTYMLGLLSLRFWLIFVLDCLHFRRGTNDITNLMKAKCFYLLFVQWDSFKLGLYIITVFSQTGELKIEDFQFKSWNWLPKLPEKNSVGTFGVLVGRYLFWAFLLFTRTRFIL